MKDYSKFHFLLILFLALWASGCTDDDSNSVQTLRYSNRSARPEVRTVRIAEARDQPYTRDGKDLPYDLLYPEGELDPVKNDLIVVVHEGAFAVGDKDNFLVQKMCRSLARKGHVAAAINYSKVHHRLQGVRASIVDAVLDVDGVVRHIQMEYGFTPENTTIVGYSAGGVIATQLALSQASELEHYAEVSLGVPVFNDKPFARVVSIAGGLMDFNHIDDGDLDNIEMLMIHGTADQMVPFTRGGGMDGYVNRDVKIAPPVGWEIEIGLVGPLNPRIVVPAQTLTFLRNTFLNDEICGPDCIVDELRGNLNFEVLAVVGGPHDLFYNSDLGALNRTYGKIIDRIDGFAGDRNRHGRER